MITWDAEKHSDVGQNHATSTLQSFRRDTAQFCLNHAMNTINNYQCDIMQHKPPHIWQYSPKYARCKGRYYYQVRAIYGPKYPIYGIIYVLYGNQVPRLSPRVHKCRGWVCMKHNHTYLQLHVVHPYYARFPH